MEIKRIVEFTRMLNEKSRPIQSTINTKARAKTRTATFYKDRPENTNQNKKLNLTIGRTTKKKSDWKERIKMEALAEEKKAVSELIDWYNSLISREKRLIKKHDPNYYDPDYDEDES